MSNQARRSDVGRCSVSYNLRFPGQYFDAETGLFYNGRRDYDPQVGRYVESDPILGLSNAATPSAFVAVPYLIKDPRNLQPYSYVAGNPLSRSDPKGLFWLIDCVECIYYNVQINKIQKLCRDEYKGCATIEDEIEFIDRYGGDDVGGAIYKCTQENAGPELWGKTIAGRGPGEAALTTRSAQGAGPPGPARPDHEVPGVDDCPCSSWRMASMTSCGRSRWM